MTARRAAIRRSRRRALWERRFRHRLRLFGVTVGLYAVELSWRMPQLSYEALKHVSLYMYMRDF